MSKSLLTYGPTFLCLMLLISGCGSTSQAKNFNGLSTPDGNAVAHMSTTNIALHLLFGSGKPLVGDASLEKTVGDFTAAAKAAGAQKVRIVQSTKTALWFLFPPVSFFITPVISNVAGDALQ